jgi:4-hydroxybenzoate polyprenyltransferase
VKPTEGQISTRQAVLQSAICLAISITLSSPLFYYTTLEIKQNLFTDR